MQVKLGCVGVTAKDNGLFVEAVLYRYRAGISWRDLPERFGDFCVIHLRHSRWSQKNVWKKLFELLSQEAGNKYAMIDSTIVRAHQHNAGAKKKRKKIKPSKGLQEDKAQKFMRRVRLLAIRRGFI